MNSVHIKENDWQKLPAPWVSKKSDITNLVVRIPPSQRWRRVYHFLGGVAGAPIAINEKENFYYVISKNNEWTEVILPFEASI